MRRLDGRLSPCRGYRGTSIIVISAGGVTLDLNGFTVAGPTVCSGTPVSSCIPAANGDGIVVDAAAQGVKIHDGIVRGMRFGITVRGYNGRIERIQALNNRLTGLSVGGLTFGRARSSIAPRRETEATASIWAMAGWRGETCRMTTSAMEFSRAAMAP